MTIFGLLQWLRFYFSALTKYQLHSPFVFDLACAVLEDRRRYYAFIEIEQVRAQMLLSDAVLEVHDLGTGAGGPTPLPTLVRRAGSSARQGRQLFRLANWVDPKTMLELGTSVGISAMYLQSGALRARTISLEGCPQTAQLARINLEVLGLQRKTEVIIGDFAQTLPGALEALKTLDLVYIDGNHRMDPTLRYFEQCLAFAHEKTVFVFDDMHWSEEMAQAWAAIQAHPRVTLTVDFFDLSLAFINPDFREKLHYNIVPSRWKFWKIL